MTSRPRSYLVFRCLCNLMCAHHLFAFYRPADYGADMIGRPADAAAGLGGRTARLIRF